MVSLAVIREFRYEYAALSPWNGDLDYMTLEKMNTENMSRFLKQVSERHEQDFIVLADTQMPPGRDRSKSAI